MMIRVKDNYYISMRKAVMIMHKIYSMGTKTIYQALVNKAERKNRRKEEVDEVIRWLTNYSQDEIDSQVDADIPYSQFF